MKIIGKKHAVTLKAKRARINERVLQAGKKYYENKIGQPACAWINPSRWLNSFRARRDWKITC